MPYTIATRTHFQGWWNSMTRHLTVLCSSSLGPFQQLLSSTYASCPSSTWSVTSRATSFRSLLKIFWWKLEPPQSPGSRIWGTSVCYKNFPTPYRSLETLSQRMFSKNYARRKFQNIGIKSSQVRRALSHHWCTCSLNFCPYLPPTHCGHPWTITLTKLKLLASRQFFWVEDIGQKDIVGSGHRTKKAFVSTTPATAKTFTRTLSTYYFIAVDGLLSEDDLSLLLWTF